MRVQDATPVAGLARDAGIRDVPEPQEAATTGGNLGRPGTAGAGGELTGERYGVTGVTVRDTEVPR